MGREQSSHVRKEIWLKGTPKDLALKIDDLNLNQEELFGEGLEWFIPGELGMELTDDKNPIYVSIKAGEKQLFGEVRHLADNRTLFTIYVTNSEWVIIEPSWNVLLHELGREGWLDAQNEQNASLSKLSEYKQGSSSNLDLNPPKKKSGRKPDPENDIAYRMMIEGEFSEDAKQAAFDYWCKEKNIDQAKKRDRDAFSKAMKRAAQRHDKST